MADPDLTSVLEEIRERSAKAVPGFSSNPGTYIDSAADVPHLLAAVEVALGFHEEFRGACVTCLDACGEPVMWPCAEYRDIAAALADIPRGEAGSG
jgi:hypothetical protein